MTQKADSLMDVPWHAAGCWLARLGLVGQPVLGNQRFATRRTAAMDEQVAGRFEVVVESGSPRGDLYKLEQKTYFQIIDRQSQQIVLVFESLMEATLSRDTGMWDDYQ